MQPMPRGRPEDNDAAEGWGGLGEEDLWAATAKAIAPAEDIDALEFGTRYRVYGKEGKAARWRPEETPWAAEILTTLSDGSPFRRIVSPKGTQLGFTELGLIWVGEGILHGASTLFIEPTEAVAKRIVKTKFRPMLKSTTALAGFFSGRAADTTLHFSNDNVDVIFAGSNSPVNFASTTVPRVVGDEIDRWSDELKDEGDPLDLLENRIAEYGFLGKIFLPSSPKILGASAVWSAWLESDQRIFECPCPNCDEKSQFLWENMEKDPETGRLTGKLQCMTCGVASSEVEWKSIWGRGAWRITCPNPVRPDTAGFHLSTLYARLGQRTWAQLIVQYEAVLASGLSSRMQTFWNTVLGLPWKVSEDAMAVDELRSRLEAGLERGFAPLHVLLLTAGIDYQKNRVEIFIWGHARARERWLVDKVVVERLKADGTARPSKDVAADMKRLALEKVWPHEAGGSLNVEYALHDTADHPADVFDIIDHLTSTRNCGSLGREGWGQKLPFNPAKIVDVKRDGKVVATGRRRTIINTAIAKSEWYDDLRRGQNEDVGAGGPFTPSERYVHFGEWVDEEEGLLEQFVSEEIRKSTRGKLAWVKVFARNEGLDCAIMAAGAAWQLKAHRWSENEWKRREALVQQERKPDPEPSSNGGRRGRVGGRF